MRNFSRFLWRITRDRRAAKQQELREEIEFYLEQRAEEFVAQGLSRSDAEHAARDVFGPIDDVERACRTGDDVTQTSRRSPMIPSLVQDIRYAARANARRPMFATVVILTLALGIGSTTTIFSVADHVLIRPMPFERPEELVIVGTTWTDADGKPPVEVAQMTSAALSSTSALNFVDWRAGAQSFSAMAGASSAFDVMTGEGPPERIRLARISEDFLSVLGVAPMLGRPFTADEYADPAVSSGVLSDGFWRRRFGGDPNIIGQRVRAVGRSFTVVGVMPPGFEPPEALWLGNPDVWLPVNYADGTHGDRQRRIMRVVARLKDDVTLEQTRRELDALSNAMLAEYPELTWRGSQTRIAIRSLHEETVRDVSRTIVVLFGAVSLLLLIACLNVSNLSLAHGMDRAREFALRGAIGAGRGRIVRQILTESVLLSCAGGFAGIGFAYMGVGAFIALNPGGIPRVADLGVDLRILLFALSLSVLTGIMFGLVPALHNTKTDVSDTLRQGGPTATTSRVSLRLRHGLVVLETSFAIVLLVGAGLLLNSFVRLAGVDPGFDPTRVAMMQVRLGDDYDTEEKRVAFFDALVSRLSMTPRVLSASAIMNAPIGDVYWRTRIVANVVGINEDDAPTANVHTVAPNYFEAMRIPLREGRDIEATDRAGAPKVAVVNEALARRYWPNENAVGKTLRIPDRSDDWVTVVGVVGNIRQMGLGEEVFPAVYFPYAQLAWLPIQTLVVRYDGDLTPIAQAMQAAVWEAEPDVPLPAVTLMEDRIASSIVQPRFYMVLLTSFAVLAFLLASAGVYSTLHYTVRGRTRELGIRLALGARRAEVVGMIIRQGMTVVGLGLVVGLVGAIGATRALNQFLFEITPGDPSTFLAVTIIFAITGVLACYIPARRATRVDPVRTLRTD